MPPERLRRSRLLPAVTLCLCATILFKSAGLIDAAFANDTSQSTPPVKAAQAADPQQKPYRPVANWTQRPPPPPLCKPDPLDQSGERKILLHLRAKAKKLDARAAKLDQQQRALDLARTALSKQAAALKPLAAHLEAMNAAHLSADKRRWNALVSTFASMDPHSAAKIFDGLDAHLVINVLKRMQSRKSAPILADMTPEKAQKVTAQLADQTDAKSSDVRTATSHLPDGAP